MKMTSRMNNQENINHPDPFHLFRQWYLEAVDSDISDPTIMSLATVGDDGKPSVRIVLLKDFNERGFVFYTNYKSRKAIQLDANPWAALVIHWQRLGQQVRIEGRVEKILEDESDRYFATRPRGNQLGAWASEQSQTLHSDESLEEALHNAEEEFRDMEVPRPPHWGGYRLEPVRIEFWVNRDNRMHDRILYEKIPLADSSENDSQTGPASENSGTRSGESGKNWISKRLAP
jgi:pyridoxamine 5'-phosphate oxidase